MPQKILIQAGELQIRGELHDTPTAQVIARALPLEAKASTWGDEIYFSIPVQADLDASAREVVEAGDIGYWPRGAALCLFFGPTPISREGEIRPASAVNIVGVLQGEIQRLRAVADGTIIKVLLTEQG